MKKKTRRDFLKTAGVAAAAPLSLAAGVAAQDKPKDAAAATVQALTDIVRARHGRHLTEAQLKDIRRDLERTVLLGDLLKRTRLENSDEPAFVFVAEQSATS